MILYINMLHYFIIKSLYIIKLYKAQEVVLNNTAAQLLFIDIQKNITRDLKAKNNNKV